MPFFRDFIRTTFVPRKSKLHDAVDTGNDLILTDGVEIDFPIDGLTRNYTSDGAIWDAGQSLIKDTIDNAFVTGMLRLVVNGGNQVELHIRIYIPNTVLGDIPVELIHVIIPKNNFDWPFRIPLLLYNGTDSDAKTYGFKVRVSAVGGNVILKDRSISLAI